MIPNFTDITAHMIVWMPQTPELNLFPSHIAYFLGDEHTRWIAVPSGMSVDPRLQKCFEWNVSKDHGLEDGLLLVAASIERLPTLTKPLRDLSFNTESRMEDLTVIPPERLNILRNINRNAVHETPLTISISSTSTLIPEVRVLKKYAFTLEVCLGAYRKLAFPGGMSFSSFDVPRNPPPFLN